MNVWKYVIDWLPFLIFLGLLIFFMRKTGFGSRQAEYMAKHTEHIAYMQRYSENHLEETRKISESLRRIAAALEQKNPYTPAGG